MYLPPHYAESRPERLHALVRERPFAALVLAAPGGFEVNHLPLLFADGPDGPVLRGHVSRANPAWRLAGAGANAVAIFSGPQAYVPPAGYPSKAEHGRVVPTWNYLVVHAHGPVRAIEDADWLRAHVTALTAANESGREHPWHVTDAPADYVAAQLRGIVGLELRIGRLEGKWKLGQNRSRADREGAAALLATEPSADAREVAKRMREDGA